MQVARMRNPHLKTLLDSDYLRKKMYDDTNGWSDEDFKHLSSSRRLGERYPVSVSLKARHP